MQRDDTIGKLNTQNTHTRTTENREEETDAHIPKKQKLSTFITPQEIDSEFSHHLPSVARINNGSFGSCPSSVIAAQRLWQLKYLRQPDHFYFNSLRKGIPDSRHAIKNLINADDVSEVSIVDNATTAAAIVLQQMARSFYKGRLAEGDAVVMLYYAFGVFKKSLEVYVTRAGGRMIEVRLPFPLSPREQIVSEFRKALERGKLEGSKRRGTTTAPPTQSGFGLVPQPFQIDNNDSSRTADSAASIILIQSL